MILSSVTTGSTATAYSKTVSATANAASAATAATATATAATSTTLTTYVPSSADDDLTYTRPNTIFTWGKDPTDAISRTMFKDINDSSWHSLKPSFKGLGSALLERFTTTQANLSQSVTKGFHTIGARSSPFGASQIQLKITMASGKAVNVAITFAGYSSSTDGSLGVKISTSGTLTQSESKAIAKLSDAFETALQGIADNTQSPRSPNIPTVDLSGLMQYDSSAIGAIDLNVQESAQFNMKALTFHADSKQRSVSMQTGYGITDFKVDLSKTGIIGTQAQQEAAISGYLAQFDAANARARGEAQLLEQFKGLFTQLESNLPGTLSETDSGAQGALNTTSRQYLSGLADFQASMRGKFSNGRFYGPYTTKAGNLDYRISQRTEVSTREGASQATQTVSSKLQAKILQTRNGARLDVTNGNYDVYTIRDTDTTVTTLTQQDGAVKAATTTRLIDQLEQYRQLVDHRVADSRDTPYRLASSQNLLDAD